jgi:hypothetical protein
MESAPEHSYRLYLMQVYFAQEQKKAIRRYNSHCCIRYNIYVKATLKEQLLFIRQNFSDIPENFIKFREWYVFISSIFDAGLFCTGTKESNTAL